MSSLNLNKDDLLSLQRYATTLPHYEAREIETEIQFAKNDIEEIDEIVAKLNYLFWEKVKKEKEEKRIAKQRKMEAELPF